MRYEAVVRNITFLERKLQRAKNAYGDPEKEVDTDKVKQLEEELEYLKSKLEDQYE